MILLNEKINLLLTYLSNNYGINVGKLLIIDGYPGKTIYHNIAFRNKSLPMKYIISDNMESIVEINLIDRVPESKDKSLRILLNQFNRDNGGLTFRYISGSGVKATINYVTTNEEFNPAMLVDGVLSIMRTIDQIYYDKIINMIKGEC